ncbi:MAG: hypothetical protein RLY71_1783, partial [Pseudomonadota bacterium]
MQTLPLFPDAAPDGSAAIDTAELLAELQRWVEAGWLRRLDLALARFIAEQASATAPAV